MKNYIKKGFIVNDIKNFVFGPAKAPVYGFGRNRKQKFVMSFTICVTKTIFYKKNSVSRINCINILFL